MPRRKKKTPIEKLREIKKRIDAGQKVDLSKLKEEITAPEPEEKPVVDYDSPIFTKKLMRCYSCGRIQGRGIAFRPMTPSTYSTRPAQVFDRWGPVLIGMQQMVQENFYCRTAITLCP